MSNQFIDLPVPASDGVGASVDVSVLGRRRTINLVGTFTAVITVEISNDGGSTFVSLTSFTGGGKRLVEVAAEFMRVRVANSTGTVTANCDVSGNDNGTQALTLPVPAGNGVGASVDVSALGTFNTFVVTGQFTGNVILEVSSDGVDFVDCMSRNSVGESSGEFIAQFARVRRAAVNQSNPGTPTVGLGATNDATSATGGGATTWVSLTDTPGAVNPDEFVRGNGFGTDLVFFDLFGSANTWTADQYHQGDIIPTVDDVYNVGDVGTPRRFDAVISSLAVAWEGSPIPNVALGQGGAVVGESSGPGTFDLDFGGAGFSPIALFGKATTTAPAGTARLVHEGGGSFMAATAYASSGTAEVETAGTAYGTFVGGYVFRPGGAGTARLAAEAASSGSFIWGYVGHQGNGQSEIIASAYGCFVAGRTTGTGDNAIRASINGAFAQGIAYGNVGGSVIEAGGGQGSFAQGAAVNSGLIESTAQGARAMGYAVSPDASVRATGAAATASGVANAAVGPAVISAAGPGSHASGYASSLQAAVTGGVLANGAGSFAHGFAQQPVGGAGNNYVRADGVGAAAFGSAQGLAALSEVEAAGAGSFAQGYALDASVIATGIGAFAQGVAGGLSDIVATQAGAFASGVSYGGQIAAIGIGARAMGVALTFGVFSSGVGSFAMGSDNTGAIGAGADNATQFGPGTNFQADSLQVGSAGLRFLGIVGPPAVVQDGDFWISGGAVYVRTGGVTKNLNNVP